jgi:aerobic carbon-monoxide dehydrogenase large subunit
MTTTDLAAGAMRRREDPPLLRGEARYTDDLAAPGSLHAGFVRAPLAHGRVLAVEAAAAAAMPAVVGVFTAADLALPPMAAGSAPAAFARPALAGATVRFLGEPVAVVVAGTRAQAVDAAGAVAVDYQPLPVVVDPLEAAGDQAPLLFPEAGSNLARQRPWPARSTALKGAEVVVRARFVNQRLAAVPLEPNAALAVPDPERDAVTLYVPCQAPFWVRDQVAAALGLPAERVRVVAPAVGGGFGARIATYPEQVVVAALARRLGRPVRYVESRSESMLAMTHGRAQVQEVELGATRDGTITGLRARVVGDAGAYPGEAGYLPGLTRLMASGVYRIPRIEVATACVVTNTTPVAAYRGPAGRRPPPCSSGPSTCSPASSAWTRLSCAGATCSAPTSSPTPRPPRPATTPATTRPRSDGSWRRPATPRSGPSRPSGAAAATASSSASACRCTWR